MPSSPNHPLVRLADGVDRVVGAVCSLIVVATTLTLLAVLGANVVMRYAFEQGGLPWVSEIPEQLFPWMIAAGIVLAVQHGAHIAVDVLFTLIGPLATRILAIAIQLLIVAAYVVLFMVVINVADIVAIERSPLMGLSRSWGYYALAFGAAGTALCSLTIALRVVLVGTESLPQANAEESPV